MGALSNQSAFPSFITMLRSKLKHGKSLQKAFYDTHLVYRKFILSSCAKHFNFNKHEPAPLLGKKLLDIGCGNSRLAEELAFRGADCLAVDIDSSCINQAQDSAAKHGSPVEFMRCPAEELVKDNYAFDVIICTDVFEYTPDIKRLVWSLRKLLKPEGVIVYTATNRTFLSRFLLGVSLPFLQIKQKNNTPKRLIRPRELQALFKKEKLNLSVFCGLGFDPKFPVWFKTSDKRFRYLGSATHEK